jgi:membrane protease YdiL (CAAX protease family)
MNTRGIVVEDIHRVALGIGAQMGLVVLVWIVVTLRPSFIDSLNAPRPLVGTWKEVCRVYLLAISLAPSCSFVWQWRLEHIVVLGWNIPVREQLFLTLVANGNLPMRWLVHMFFFAVVVAPITEEILFRGILLRFLKNHWSTTPAQIVSALCFGAAHGEWVAFFPLVGLGLLFGHFYLKSGKLLVPILTHSLFNGTTFVLSLFSQDAALGSCFAIF